VPGRQRDLPRDTVGGRGRSRGVPVRVAGTACVGVANSSARLTSGGTSLCAGRRGVSVAQRSVRFSQDGRELGTTASRHLTPNGRRWALRGATASAPKAASSLPRFTGRRPGGTRRYVGRGPSVEVVPLGEGVASMTPELDSYREKAAKGPDAGADSRQSRVRGSKRSPKARAAAARSRRTPRARHPRAPCVVPALDFRSSATASSSPALSPKAFPVDPHRNHLAVHVEDHPLNYASFLGEIPAGRIRAGLRVHLGPGYL